MILGLDPEATVLAPPRLLPVTIQYVPQVTAAIDRLGRQLRPELVVRRADNPERVEPAQL